MIRVAIIGAGIGAEHLAGYRALPDAWEVALIVDRDAARATAMARDIPVATEIETALSDASIDVIDICLPPALHVPVTLDALAAGKHVICEKPLAPSLAEIDQLDAARKAAGREIFPVFQYRYGPGIAALRRLQDAGLTGAPIMAALETHWSRDADYYAVPWRGTWDGERGGAIVTHAIHIHDLLCHVMAPVTEVSAHLTTRVNPIETEDCAALSFTLEGGALATSSVTLGAAQDETRARFVFEGLTATSGTLPYTPADGAWTFTAREPDRQSKIDAIVAETKALSRFEGAFAEIAKCLGGADGKAVSFEDGRRSIALVTAIYDAARSGRRVALPLSDTHPLYGGWLP